MKHFFTATVFATVLLAQGQAMAQATAAAPVAIPQASLQAPVITRDSRYVYHRTPLKNMASAVRAQVFRSSSVLLGKQLVRLRNAGVLPKELTAEGLSSLKVAYSEIDKLVSSIETSAINKVQDDASLARLTPSAIFITVGGKFSANLKVGGGGSVSLGLVLVPVYVERQALMPEEGEAEKTAYIEYEMALIAWPNAEIGRGFGGGVGTRVGLGLIWGPIEKPQDFVGPLLGISKSVAMAGVGMTAKGGVLNNWSKPGFGQFPFVMAALEMGAITMNEAHWNLSYVIEGSKILAALGFDPGMLPSVERIQVPTMDQSNLSAGLFQP